VTPGEHPGPLPAAPPRPRRLPVRRLSPRAAGWGALLLLVFWGNPGYGLAPALSGRLDAARSREKLEQELERTDRVLERAADQLRDCSDRKAGLLMEEAKKNQDRARRAGANPTAPGGLEQALRLTLLAREQAVRAIEACVQPVAEEALRRLLDSTQDLLSEAAGEVKASANLAAQRLLEAGSQQLDRAREAYRGREYERAATLGGMARNLILRARQRLRERDAVGARPRAELALERTDLLLAEIRGHAEVLDDAKARALLERAEEQQEQASDLLRQGRIGPALRLTRLAREEGLKAFWRANRAPKLDSVRRAIDLVESLYADLAPSVRESGDAEAIRLLDLARDRLAAARDRLREGSAEPAAQAARQADSLLRRATERLRGD